MNEEKKVKFRISNKCNNCKRYKDKKCPGYKFSVKIISMYCKDFEELNK
ncbi:hypothetical protein [Clostridium sp.]